MMIVVKNPISLSDVRGLAESGFGNLVKGVVDTEKKFLILGGDLHADEEAEFIKSGSKQDHLWGINIYPDLPYPDRIEFDSMINVRPREGNMARGVDDPELRNAITDIIKALITE